MVTSPTGISDDDICVPEDREIMKPENKIDVDRVSSNANAESLLWVPKN